MQQLKPFVLTVAGFDPCSGAGLSADLKTFEQIGVYGLAVCTGLTLQTESKFHSVEWRKLEDVSHEIMILFDNYNVKSVKIGIVPDFYWVNQIVQSIKLKKADVKIVLDPVWKSSTGYKLNESSQYNELLTALAKIDLITPNNDEIRNIFPDLVFGEKINLLKKQSAVLLKNYYSAVNAGTDVLYENDSIHEINTQLKNYYPKHGSGCVFSSAVTAYLALENKMLNACVLAKRYTEFFLNSNKTQLGYHVV